MERYPELGQVDQKVKFYKKGERLPHPSGITYELTDKGWKIVSEEELRKNKDVDTH